MKKVVYLILAIALIFPSQFVYSQNPLKKLRQKTERAKVRADEKTDEKIDNAVDNTVDGAIDKVGNVFKKKTKNQHRKLLGLVGFASTLSI